MAGNATSAAALTSGTTWHAHLERDVVGLELPEPARALMQAVGVSSIGQFYGGSEPFGEFTFSLPIINSALLTLANGSLADTTTISNWTMFASNMRQANLPQLGASFAMRFQSRSSGTDGDPYYLNLIFPALEMHFLSPGFTRDGGVNTSMARFRAAPTVTGKHPNGVAFGASLGLSDNQTDWYYAITAKPLAYSLYISDGTATTYTTRYRPTSSAVTASDNWYTRNSTSLAPTTHATSTGIVTMAAAGAALDANHAIYQTDFVLSP